MADGDIVFNIEGSVARVVLNRPPVNAFNDSLVRGFNDALDETDANGEVSVMHIKSELKAFSAGADLELMRDCLRTTDGRDRMIETVRELQRLFERIEKLGVVSIAEIGGAAVGGGLELALSCDLRIAADQAKLGLPEAGLGLLPAAGGTQRLPRVCGEAVARRIILGGEVVDGNEAHRLGLVHWVTAADELESRSVELVARFAALPPATLAACKRCIAAAADPAVDGYELELTETRRLHDDAETRRRVAAVLKK